MKNDRKTNQIERIEIAQGTIANEMNYGAATTHLCLIVKCMPRSRNSSKAAPTNSQTVKLKKITVNLLNQNLKILKSNALKHG